MNMSDKVVVITGAAGGLGWQTALLLKASGAKVIGLDIVDNAGAHVIDAFHRIDITDPAAIADVAQQISSRFGDVDVLVNNAAMLSIDRAEAGVTETVRRAMDVNLFGAWQLTAALLPGLLRKRGKVINVSSLFALVNAPHVAAYAASKRALFAFSDILRMQYRGRLDVVTVFPGFMDTPIHRTAEAVGLSVKRLVSFKIGQWTLLSLEESVPRAAAGLVRACARGGGRNRGLTLLGTLTMFTARIAPSLVDMFISWRISTLIRGGHLRLQLELIE